jgi:hypothetical protein
MSVQRVSRTSRPPRPGIDWLNKVGQAVNDHEQRSKTFGPRQARPINPDLDRLIVLVKNTSESDIARYRPIDIDGAALEESDDIVLLGVAPAGGVYAIAQEPIPAGKIGRCCIQGVTRAYIEFPATTGDTLATFAETSHLAPGSGNGVVLFDFAASEDTVKLGIILLGGGGGAACSPSYELRHWYFPSGGSSEIEVTYNAVTETIELPFNATPSQVKTAIDAHTEMVAASVECTASSIPGGNLWRSAVIVRMPIGGTIGIGATPDGDLAPDASTDYEPHVTVVECGCQ